MRAAKVDANHGEIVKALRDIGASVQSLAPVGRGVPDLLVGYRRANYLLEVKDTGGRMTEQQEWWHDNWRGRVVVVRTVDEALEAIGVAQEDL